MVRHEDRDEYPDRLAEVLTQYIANGANSALEALRPIAFEPSIVTRRSAIGLRTIYVVHCRDGWLCRYCGTRTIYLPVLVLLGTTFPREFPYHPNWKSGATHPAVLMRTATVDHVVPGTHGGSWMELDNLATACWPCNAQKGEFTLEQMGWRLLPIPENTG